MLIETIVVTVPHFMFWGRGEGTKPKNKAIFSENKH